jgi:hypothetical protein
MAPGDDEGFLSRWSRRKVESRDSGVETPHPTPLPAGERGPELPLPLAGEGRGEGQSPPPPPPTLDDVAALKPDADFSRFVAADVAPGVKNAALKKLFSDPHYNVMDGLDTYIADYNKPDPLPVSMLRKMAQSKFLAPPEQAEADENADLRLQPDDAAGRPGADESAAAEPGQPDDAA